MQLLTQMLPSAALAAAVAGALLFVFARWWKSASRCAGAIAIGAGSGAELRQPLGIAVVGGLCVSQLLTLFITPVIYIYLDRIDRRLKRRLEPNLDEADGIERPHVVAAE